jgi:hypothetical protein
MNRVVQSWSPVSLRGTGALENIVEPGGLKNGKHYSQIVERWSFIRVISDVFDLTVMIELQEQRD